MKKSTRVFRWIGVVFFCLMAVSALAQGGIFGALLLLLGAALISPLDAVKALCEKLNLNKTISIVLAVVLFVFGVLLTPAPDVPADSDGDVQIEGSVTDDNSGVPNSPQFSPEEKDTESKDEGNDAPAITDAPDKVPTTPTTTAPEDTTEPTQPPSNPVASGVGKGKAEAVKLSDIPPYSGKAYTIVSNNIPNFSADELRTTGYEKYSNLDSLGRTQMALASVGKDTMPKANEERGSISGIKPTGWEQASYDGISGGWLYNRCHLIGWQLSAENANSKNLITGTKYLNVSGMLPFENMVADYINETGNHVAYRITPIYQGNNLLASGVQMEAYSVEDSGAGICFNVYCYNVQPEITINYATGVSTGPSSSKPEDQTTSEITTEPKPPVQTPMQDEKEQVVYITKTGKKYHSRKNCSGLSNANAIFDSTLAEAEGKGLTPCSKCH